jgi:pyruvate-ferredoxin/flavodoxin oxidoreductase
VRDNNIRVYILPGFDIAKKATSRSDLQLRMQGNSFLGAFFRVSPFLNQNGITEEQFHATVRKQYQKKFGRFGDDVVTSNMTVMTEGFSRVQEIIYGEYSDPDRSSMRNPPVQPWAGCRLIPHRWLRHGLRVGAFPHPRSRRRVTLSRRLAKFDSEYRKGLGYHQPAGALASLGVMGAGSGATQSKYVARRETPVYIAENCTQCMECITACPDTALPNTSQDVATVLKTAAVITSPTPPERTRLVAELKGVEQRARAKMNDSIKAKSAVPFKDIIRDEVNALSNISAFAKAQFSGIIDILPIAYSNVPAIYRSLEQKTPGAGGLFPFLCPTSAKAAANASRFAATTTPCA